jgi:hypothetical protein
MRFDGSSLSEPSAILTGIPAGSGPEPDSVEEFGDVAVEARPALNWWTGGLVDLGN